MHQARANSTRPPQASLAVRGSEDGAGAADADAGLLEAAAGFGAAGSGAAKTGLRGTGRKSPAFSVTMGLDAVSRRKGAEAGGDTGRVFTLVAADAGAGLTGTGTGASAGAGCEAGALATGAWGSG